MTYFSRVTQSRGGAKVIKNSKKLTSGFKVQIKKCVWFGVLHRTALHACYPFLFTMSPKGKLAICGFCKTLHTEWSKADLFILNIASAFTHTSNMPRRGILLKISYMMSRKSLFCNTNYSSWSGTGLHIRSHICTTRECFEVGEVLLVPHQ